LRLNKQWVKKNSVAFLSPFLILTVANLLCIGIGIKSQFFVPLSGKKLLIIFWALIAEELGWRGYLQERIEKMVPCKYPFFFLCMVASRKAMVIMS